MAEKRKRKQFSMKDKTNTTKAASSGRQVDIEKEVDTAISTLVM